MNIEQAIDILKNSIADYVIGEYCEKCADNKICDDRNEDCYFQQAIDIVVTAYEKEKEKNKEILSGNIESFQKYFLEEFNKKFISIDKLKEIVDECIPKKENIITRELEYTPNANANSYLTQEILSLIKEE